MLEALQQWQKKFPKVFEEYSGFIAPLALQEQASLSELLATIESNGLLKEAVLENVLLSARVYLTELVYLIEKLAEHGCLNEVTLNYLFLDHLFSEYSLVELAVNIRALEDRKGLTAETIRVLFSGPDPSSSALFILRALHAELELNSIIRLLSRSINRNGLRRAITLFDLSSLPYDREHFKKFGVLVAVLANPLCQTIFDARLRGFSDYSVPTEPVNSREACALLSQLLVYQAEEARIRLFFNFFAPLRPFPVSQRDLVAVNIAEEVARGVKSYCRAEIKAIESQQDYLVVSKIISDLENKRNMDVVFDNIKYPVASAIEATDLCSTRDYYQLMDEIKRALSGTQEDLQEDLKDIMGELKSTKGHFRTTRSLVRRNSFLTQASKAVSDETQELSEPRAKRCWSMP